MKPVDNVDGWRCRAAPVGLYVYDVKGDKIGEIGALYYVDDPGLPEWMSIRTGFLGLKTRFAPMAGGSIRDGNLHLPYTKDHVKDAPKPDPNGYFTTERQHELFDHYGWKRIDC